MPRNKKPADSAVQRVNLTLTVVLSQTKNKLWSKAQKSNMISQADNQLIPVFELGQGKTLKMMNMPRENSK